MVDFDVLTDPWILALDADGSSTSLGVLDALRGAPRLRGIADPSPLATFGCYRLLAAVLHHYLPITGEAAWVKLWEAQQFPSSFLDLVARRCHGRLRLFDPERPFYQSADIPLDPQPQTPLKSVGYLAPEASTGTNVVHFSHAGEASHAFCPACCARGLVQLPCFATAGGAGIKPGLNGVPPLYVMPRGETLFQTLMLNLLLPAFCPCAARGSDPGPLWEASPVVAAREERACTGLVESLTWPPRRIRLFPGPGGVCSRCGQPASTLVRRMLFAQGWSRPKALGPWPDPWVAFVRKKGADGAERIALRPSEHRDLWRDFPGLFLLHGEEAASVRPAIVEQVRALNDDRLHPRPAATFDLFGLRTDMKAKLFEWRHETFHFPRRLLASPHAGETVSAALAFAVATEGALRQALQALLRAPSFAPPDPLAHATLRGYWLDLEGEFRTRLRDGRLCGDLEPRTAWRDDWHATVRGIAVARLHAATDPFDATADELRRQVTAHHSFRRALRIAEGRNA